METMIKHHHTACLVALTSLVLTACGGGGDNGAAVQATPQTITFGTAPTLNHLGTATVTATASSGLAVSYRSTTSSICTVDASSGLVTDLSIGDCIIAAKQRGNKQYAAATEVTQTLPVVYSRSQTIQFGSAPSLSFGGTATVSATATSGLAVSYSTLTPAICTVHSTSGLVSDSQAGSCIIAANQAGSADFDPATQVTQSLLVSTPVAATVPGAPATVSATLGTLANTATISFSGTNSGGSPITSYSISSQPAGITATGTSSPITVNCPNTNCTGYAFTVSASNVVGTGTASSLAPVLADYKITQTFYEPDTQPNNSIFIGTFTYNFTEGSVSNLRGTLSESMTGGQTPYPNDTMTWLSLNNQLYAAHDAALGGTFVSVFKNNNTDTFQGGGWTPEKGIAVGGVYFGAPNANPGNAYALIFVPDTNPTTALTQAQIDKLAYADCAPGGMMGDVCMTGTGGSLGVGTMGGYPKSQLITKQ